MAVEESQILRTELRDNGVQKRGRYARRETFYCFLCIDCDKEVWLVFSDLKKVSGRCRSCADSSNSDQKSHANRIRPYECLFNKFSYDRKRANQESDLNYEDFLEFCKIKECHYCGDIITWAEFSLAKNGYRYNLDRKNNNVAYFKDNLVVCCWNCNETKSARFTYDEFILMAPALRQIREARNGDMDCKQNL